MDVTTREIAILTWSTLFLLWAGTKDTVRASFKDVLRSTFTSTILTFGALLAAFTLAEVWLLKVIGLWSLDLLKDTLGWFALTALSSSVAVMTSYDDPQYGKHVKDSLRIAVLLELLFGKLTFSLPVELVLVPFFTLVALMSALNDIRNKNPQVKRFLIGVQVAIGSIVLIGAGIRAMKDFSVLADPMILMEFLLPPILSLLFIPAMYLLVLYARYEWLFLKLQGERRFRRYAKMRLLRLLGLRPRRVLAFGRKHAFVLPSIRTRDELQQLLEGRLSTT